MKIGIITIQNAYNYGATLQAYALQQFLYKIGHDAIVIDYQNERLNRIYHSKFDISDNIYHILSGHVRSGFLDLCEKIIAKKKNTYVQISMKYEKYRKKYLHLSEKVYADDLTALLDYDVLITGSDQVWNDGITNGDPIYYLQVQGYKGIKISYAASGTICDDKTKIRMIKDIPFISVRESSLKCALQSYSIENIVRVCDPTLLIPAADWRKQTRKIDEHFILAYLMWDEQIVLDYLEELSRMKKLPVVIIHRLQKNVSINGKKYSSASPSDFLSLIDSADYVVSDSFHGTVFSVLFKKQFLSKASRVSGNRVTEFLDVLNLSDRIIQNEHIGHIDEEIDWVKVEQIITHEKNISKRFLENALGEKKNDTLFSE